MKLKEYRFKIKNGSIRYLLAKHNRDAMKLMGSWCRWQGDIEWLKDVDGNMVINNQ